MKKILMGLLAVSAICFATGQPPIAGEPQGDTTVFAPVSGQTGEIVVTGKLLSTVPVVKYVVYSSTDGTWENAKDSWDLPDLYLTQESGGNKFASTPPKIYVKKVNDGATDVEPLTDETVVFILKLDPTYTYKSSLQGEIALNASRQFEPTALLSKETLTNVIKAAGPTLSGAIVNIAGEITESNKMYRLPNKVQFISEENGELTVKLITNDGFGKLNVMSSDKVQAIENAFATGENISNVSISVKVK